MLVRLLTTRQARPEQPQRRSRRRAGRPAGRTARSPRRPAPADRPAARGGRPGQRRRRLRFSQPTYLVSNRGRSVRVGRRGRPGAPTEPGESRAYATMRASRGRPPTCWPRMAREVRRPVSQNDVQWWSLVDRPRRVRHDRPDGVRRPTCPRAPRQLDSANASRCSGRFVVHADDWTAPTRRPTLAAGDVRPARRRKAIPRAGQRGSLVDPARRRRARARLAGRRWSSRLPPPGADDLARSPGARGGARPS